MVDSATVRLVDGWELFSIQLRNRNGMSSKSYLRKCLGCSGTRLLAVGLRSRPWDLF